MPKRTDINSILIIGAGPIVIGQACEFDYAGTQACIALKKEGYRIILINSNPATIMSDPDITDVTYIEPITVDMIEKIIAKEKPDALLPTLGGQTALNCSLSLAKKGILEKYGVELIGASLHAIELAENRSQFQQLMKSIGLEMPFSFKIHSMTEAKAALKNISLPVIIRSSYTLGGSGAGLADTKETFMHLCEQAFHSSTHPEITIDEGLIGWKEFELEVIRDKKDNCIIVSGIENIDPLGIHTGDSITVSPIQTLTDKEYQSMRQDAFNILRAVGVETGGSNVQFAVHPKTGKRVVIEMNPRVSRSSALVSKATGYPIAKVAALLAVGFTLDELKNDITGEQLPASFEPSLDYVVVKIPRFNFEKFSVKHSLRGPQMQSIGEVMAIGRTFAESLQKAMRSLEIQNYPTDGFADFYTSVDTDTLEIALKTPSHMQLFAIAEALRRNMAIENIAKLTHIDLWFLHEINLLIQAEKALSSKTNKTNIDIALLKKYKRLGFSDARIAELLNTSEKTIFELRKKHDLFPVYKRVDSCAGEFVTPTAYMYSSYEQHCESNPTERKKMLVIGSGPNRIGQGIEFDYCCVHAIKALKNAGFESIMVNCNPETVSTDYDIVDRLYCIPLTLEDILDVIQKEKPTGVFVQYGGQTPLHLAKGLADAGVPLIGCDQDIIHLTESREEFRQWLQKLDLKQPKNASVYTLEESLLAAKSIGYPLIIRPSFILGGASMSVVNNDQQLISCLENILAQKNSHAILIEQFLENAIEIDVDAITDGTDVFIPTLLEQIETAGVHSGDSACITPSTRLSQEIQQIIISQAKKIGLHLGLLGLKGIFNIQFAVKNNQVYILEVNPRASRTVPFVGKLTGLPLIQIATQCALGKNKILQSPGLINPIKLPLYYAKEVVLPFIKFPKSSAMLGPEMKSTGEVMGIGRTPSEAYAKAQIACGNRLPTSGKAYLIASPAYQNKLSFLAEKLNILGFKPSQLSQSQIIEQQDFMPDNDDLIIILHDLREKNSLNEKAVRYAIENHICHATSLEAAIALIDAIEYQLKNSFQIYSLQENQKLLMKHKKPKHFLTGEELTPVEIEKLIDHAIVLKSSRLDNHLQSALSGHHLGLLFNKPSLRTRFSFAIAIRELGGDFIESIESTRKVETPEDQASVLSGYCHALMVRTHDDDVLEKMTKTSKIPIINGLSALHHPCQILADLMTMFEKFGYLNGLTLSYIGDGNNILHSFLLLAPQMGITVQYCCPPSRGPDKAILEKSLQKLGKTGKIQAFSTPTEAVKNAHVVYTDVWTSMGFENTTDEAVFESFQVNESLMQNALPNAIFMHCLPMERGKEVSETLPDSACSAIFQQSENRLHIQKALLLYLLEPKENIIHEQ